MFEYQTWADEKLFHFLTQLSEKEMMQNFEKYTSIKDRINHIVIALEVWNDRLGGMSPKKLPNYMSETTDKLIERWRVLNTSLSVYFSSRRPNSFTYYDSSGNRYKSEHEDIALHLMNHTTFYRSQIIMMIRLLGYPVENTDYIYFAREN